MANRRQYLFGAGTAAAALLGIGASHTVLAQNAAPEGIYFTEVHPRAEYLVIENRGKSTIDLTEYYINFEYGDETDQNRQFESDGTVTAGSDLVLRLGEKLVVATGAEPVSDADVTFGYTRPEINNTEPDNFALLMPDGETVVDESGKNPNPPTSTATPEEDTETTTEADTATTTQTEATNTATATTTPETETTTTEPANATTETPGGTTTDASSGVDVGDGC